MLGLFAVGGLSLVVASMGCSLVAVRGLLIAVTSFVEEHGLTLKHRGFSSCGAWV